MRDFPPGERRPPGVKPLVLLLLLLLLLTIAFAITLTGCGYSTHELFPRTYRTVAVPIFQNRSFERGTEFQLSEALVKQIQSRTPYKVTRSGSADTMLEGTITAVDRHVLSRGRAGGVPQQVEMTVRADFTWKDLRTGEVIRQRRGLQAVGRYVPTSPVGERQDLGRAQAVGHLAEAIVDAMRADW